MATVPSIGNTDRILDATATAGQTQFVISWPVIADSEAAAVNDLVVLIDGDVVDPSDFSFDGTAITGLSGVWNGGAVALDNACQGGERVIIFSDRAPRRTGNFLEGKTLPFTTLDQLLDDVVVQMRDMQLRSKRSVSISPADYLDGEDPDGLASDILLARDEAVAAATAAAGSAGAVATVGVALTAALNLAAADTAAAALGLPLIINANVTVSVPYTFTAKRVSVLPGVTVTANAALTLSGSVMVLDGILTGTGDLIMKNAVGLTGAGSITGNRVWLQGGGSAFITGPLKFSGYASTFALLIACSATLNGLLIDGIELFNCNYGIARTTTISGYAANVKGARISNFHAHDTRADGLEWDSAAGDQDIDIGHFVIERIDSTVTGNPNWGIGLGVSGLGQADATFPDSKFTASFRVHDGIFRSMRQALHAEFSKNFAYWGCLFFDISTAYSTTAGLDCVGVEISCCANYKSSSHQMYDSPTAFALLVEEDETSSPPLACTNYEIDGMHAPGSLGAVIAGGGDNNEARIGNITGCPVSILGSWSDLTLRGLRGVTTNTATAPGLLIDLSPASGFGSFVKATHSARRVTIIDCQGLFSNGTNSVPSVTTRNLNAERFEAANNNFSFNAANIAAALSQTNPARIICTDTDTPPHGVEFRVNDIWVSKTNGQSWVCTAPGSIITPETLTVRSQTQRFLSSSTDITVGGFYENGAKVTLTWGDASTTAATVVRATVYNDGTNTWDAVEFAEAIPKAIGQTCTVAATNTPTFANLAGSVTLNAGNSYSATLAKIEGQITTDSLTTAAGSARSLTVINALVSANDRILATRGGGSNSGGAPELVAVANNGSIGFQLLNNHATAAFNGTFIINYWVRK